MAKGSVTVDTNALCTVSELREVKSKWMQNGIGSTFSTDAADDEDSSLSIDLDKELAPLWDLVDDS